jgi:hypothetical protein
MSFATHREGRTRRRRYVSGRNWQQAAKYLVAAVCLFGGCATTPTWRGCWQVAESAVLVVDDDGSHISIELRDGGCIAIARSESGALGHLVATSTDGGMLWKSEVPLSELPAIDGDLKLGAFHDVSQWSSCDSACLVEADGLIVVVGYSRQRTGGLLAAFRCFDGDPVWRSRVLGLGDVVHSRYSNRIRAGTMESDIVLIGDEDAGSYMEIVSTSGRRIVTMEVGPGVLTLPQAVESYPSENGNAARNRRP